MEKKEEGYRGVKAYLECRKQYLGAPVPYVRKGCDKHTGDTGSADYGGP